MTDDQPLPGVWRRHQRGGAGEVETTPSSPGLGEGGEGIGEARPCCTVGLLEHELRCAGDSDECLETLAMVRSRS